MQGEPDDVYWDVAARVRGGDENWGVAALLDDDSLAYRPAVAAGHGAGALVIWVGNPGGVRSLHCRRYEGGTWQDAETVATVVSASSTVWHGDGKGAAVDAVGRAVVTWTDEGRVWASHYQ